MAYFKGDRTYDAHVDDEPPLLSDESTEEPDAFPRKLDFPQWLDRYYGEVNELFRQFTDAGERLFGGAFMQSGTLAQFALSVYNWTYKI